MIVSQAAGTAPRPERGPAEYRLPEDRVSIRRPGFDTLAALAVLQAEIGEPHTADTHFGASRARYRSVSPFPLAILDYQHGRMWLAAGDLDRARVWFDSALRRVPAYAPARGGLAAVRAAAGEHEAARLLLTPLAMTSDDPGYLAQLSQVLAASGQKHIKADPRLLRPSWSGPSAYGNQGDRKLPVGLLLVLGGIRPVRAPHAV